MEFGSDAARVLPIMSVVMLAVLFVGACTPPIDTGRDYVSKDKNRCEAIRFVCKDGKEPFFDTSGCGCQDMTSNDNSCDTMTGYDCKGIHYPVCGWFDPEKIQCFKYPCAAQFNNSCLACEAEDVISFSYGACPG